VIRIKPYREKNKVVKLHGDIRYLTFFNIYLILYYYFKFIFFVAQNDLVWVVLGYSMVW
jgi:hypothetical protein